MRNRRENHIAQITKKRRYTFSRKYLDPNLIVIGVFSTFSGEQIVSRYYQDSNLAKAVGCISLGLVAGLGYLESRRYDEQ